jgi:hypothetical protein
MSKLGNLALDGGDPRLSSDEGTFGGQGIVAYTRPQMRPLHDPSVTFEEYHYYAKLAREEEEQIHASRIPGSHNILTVLIPNLAREKETDEKRRASLVPTHNLSNKHARASVTDEEWTNASRALRSATAGAIFYLITTDILGPFSLPYAFGTTGWG